MQVWTHDFGEFVPAWPAEFDEQPQQSDDALIARIERAFAYSKHLSAATSADMWRVIVGHLHKEFVDHLRRDRVGGGR